MKTQIRRTKVAIARSFLDQLTIFCLQMETKAYIYIYVVQCHFEAKLFILVPNLKCEVKILDLRSENFRFLNFKGPWTCP